MGKNTKIIVILFIIALFLMRSTFAIFRNSLAAGSATTLAVWNVTLEQDGVNNDLTVVPGTANATYTLNVKSLSEVDVKYSVVISNLPSGIDVSIDGVNFPPVSNGTVTFDNAGTILYGSGDRINSHTLIFRGANGATLVNDHVVTINVNTEQLTSS